MPDSILTVVTPATARSLTDVQAVRTELGLPDSEGGSYLLTLIQAASAAIASHCRCAFAQETVREVFRLSSAEPLILARHPVASITSIGVDEESLAAPDWDLDAEAGLLWRLSSDQRIGWRGRKVTVTYVAGYLLPGQEGADLPADLQRACTLLAAASYHARGRDPMLRSESTHGVDAVSYLDPRAGMEAMPPQVAALLAPYRRFSV